jgi:hypothetical protein
MDNPLSSLIFKFYFCEIKKRTKDYFLPDLLEVIGSSKYLDPEMFHRLEKQFLLEFK